MEAPVAIVAGRLGSPCPFRPAPKSGSEAPRLTLRPPACALVDAPTTRPDTRTGAKEVRIRDTGGSAKPAAAKLQFLDFVEEIAREHGQPVPTALLEHLRGLIREGPSENPDCHGPSNILELRLTALHRTLAGLTPTHMTYPLRTLASPDVAPLRAEVETLVRRCHELGVLYASDDWSPLSDITLGLLLKRAGIQWRYCELEHAGEIVWPPVCGIHLLQLDRFQSRLERRFALRHGLAHVLAGHVADLTYAHDGHHWENPEEQLADAFAFADLIPDRMLREMQAVGFRDNGLERWVRAEISRYAPDWPAARLAMRAFVVSNWASQHNR